MNHLGAVDPTSRTHNARPSIKHLQYKQQWSSTAQLRHFINFLHQERLFHDAAGKQVVSATPREDYACIPQSSSICRAKYPSIKFKRFVNTVHDTGSISIFPTHTTQTMIPWN